MQCNSNNQAWAGFVWQIRMKADKTCITSFHTIHMGYQEERALFFGLLH
jgi:hypothetical protein